MLLEKFIKYTDYAIGVCVVISTMVAVIQLGSGNFFQACLCGMVAAFNAAAFIFVKRIDEEMDKLFASMRKLEELSKQTMDKMEKL